MLLHQAFEPPESPGCFSRTGLSATTRRRPAPSAQRPRSWPVLPGLIAAVAAAISQAWRARPGRRPRRLARRWFDASEGLV